MSAITIKSKVRCTSVQHYSTRSRSFFVLVQLPALCCFLGCLGSVYYWTYTQAFHYTYPNRNLGEVQAVGAAVASAVCGWLFYTLCVHQERGRSSN